MQMARNIQMPAAALGSCPGPHRVPGDVAYLLL